MIDEKEYRILIEQLATGGITGNKTYHQYHDQFVPIDSEGAGYANGGGVGTMMVPRKNYNQGGVASSLAPAPFRYDSRASVEDMAKAIQTSSAGTDNQKLRMLMDYSMSMNPQATPQTVMANQGKMEKLLGLQTNPNFNYMKPSDPAMLMPPMVSTGFRQDPGYFGNEGFIINGKRYMSEDEAIEDMGIETYNRFMADGGRVKPKRGLVNEPGGYAGYYGGGADFMPLGYNEDESITVEDLTVPSRVKDFSITTANALDNQDGIISAAPNVMNQGVQTIEGSLINDDYPNDPIRSMVTPPGRDFSQFDKAKMGSPANINYGYQDLIMNPEYMPNRLQNLERFQDNRFEDLDFQKGFDFKDAPNKVTNLKEFFQNKGYNNNPNVGIIDNKILSRGNPEKSLFNKTKNIFSNVKDGITSIDLPGKFKEGSRMIFSPLTALASMRDPLNPKASNYNPNLVGQLNALDQMGNMLYRDPNSGALKYGSGSVLSGQNAISGFGTNDYLGQLEKKQDYFEARIKANKKYNKDTYAATLAEIEKEKARQAAATEAAIAAEKVKAQTFMQKNPNYGNNYDPGKSYTGASDSYGSKAGTRQRDARSSDLGFSDIRLKDNIELVGKSPSDINIYNFTYLNNPKVYQGVMAHEVPWASVKHNSGYLMVDYNKVDVDFKLI